MLFLKCFHDHEVKRDKKSKRHARILPSNLRWETWTNPKNISDSKLIPFVNDVLFPKLSTFDDGRSSQKQHISLMFKGLKNSIQSPNILRQIIQKIDQLSFASSDDIHTMAEMYEDMLIEMKDASGQSGEFYTPRPVIRFIVNAVRPSLKIMKQFLILHLEPGDFW